MEKAEAWGEDETSRLAALFEWSLFGQTLGRHFSEPLGVLPQSGLELRKGGFIVVFCRAGDLRAQIAYVVVNATRRHRLECYEVLVGHHTDFCVGPFRCLFVELGPLFAPDRCTPLARKTRGKVPECGLNAKS